ncbi:MAG: UDP-2,3-diacylglucosamine diphosphatase LpxI [Deltaproteobacteria bacterium]|nr:UDP-2,3-diacylglucosamine diphosphatase LpxI [Deltaproteobacteria bacterium]MBW1952512.1 UDP-2,3-diacylglucosamine diphosphatase LpxI [Deltaproteobacteria bacterium]MBW1987273.1 UDP-2,3-diacylglucosamine diphosphatase LpxI [Deltaproteobacteria bacterium]MBW2135131.1 UDP-2,3-diacylglucosamine diphosphatase LpxI [Deltaproteobacteria bacterium]
MSEKIGLIAGSSQFPLLFAQVAQQKGLEVIAVGHYGETDPALADLVSQLEWVYVGQLGRIIRCFQMAGVSQAVMAGGIRKGRLYTHLRPDWRAINLIRRVGRVRDDGILRAVAEELEGAGITIVPSTLFLDELLAPAGLLSRRKPTPEELQDVDYGFNIAKEIGRLDIGQCVVVRRQAVLALEAIEGTDETIRRGGRLAGEKAVVVKVSKPGQDLRFDVPAVGLETIKVMIEVKAAVLAVEAGKTLIFNREAMLNEANRARLAVLGVSEPTVL